MEHLGRRMRVGVSECVWGFSAGLRCSIISHGRLWISGVGCLLYGLGFCQYRHRYVDGDIYLARLCLLEWPGLRDIRVRTDDNVNVWGLNHSLTICW